MHHCWKTHTIFLFFFWNVICIFLFSSLLQWNATKETSKKKFSLKDKQKQIWKMLIALIQQQQQHTIRSKDKDKRKCSIEKKRGNGRKKRSRRENDNIHTELEERRQKEKEKESEKVERKREREWGREGKRERPKENGNEKKKSKKRKKREKVWQNIPTSQGTDQCYGIGRRRIAGILQIFQILIFLFFCVWPVPIWLPLYFLPLSDPCFHLPIKWRQDTNPRRRTMAEIVIPWRSTLVQGASLLFPFGFNHFHIVDVTIYYRTKNFLCKMSKLSFKQEFR